MFPFLLIALGFAVLAFGSRLAVVGAAVGGILGVALLRLLPWDAGLWLTLLIPGGLALLFFFGSGVVKGGVGLLTLVLGVVAGAAITLNVLDLFNISFGLMDWVLAVVGGCIGAVLVRSFSQWSLIILAGLVGSILTIRGLGILLPWLDGLLATSLALLLAAGSIAYQGGLFKRPSAQPN